MKRRELVRMLGAAGVCAAGAGIMPALARGQMVAPAGLPHPLLPLFPLGVVLLPGNSLPLHIFEPRYREMVQECIDTDQEFGVLRVTGGSIAAVGCTARVTDVIHRYRDGRLDIVTKGERRFRLSPVNRGLGLAETSALTEADFNAERAFFRGSPAFLDDDSPSRAAAPSSGKHEDAELIAQALELRGRLMGLIGEDDPKSSLPRQKLPAAAHPQLSFQLMDGLPAEADWKQALLELRKERERLVRVVLHLQQLIDYMQSDPENPTPRPVA